MRWSIVLVGFACGSQPLPSPVVVQPATGPAPAPAPITCGDAGVLLRGSVDDGKHAGPAKEAAIARACLHDRWPAAVIECVGTSRFPHGCLDRLSPEQHAGYTAKLRAWSEAFPNEPLDDDLAADDHDDAPVSCDDAVGEVDTYAPALPSPEPFAVALRETRIRALCEAWPNAVRRCLYMGNLPSQCRALLPPDQERAVTDALAEADAIIAKRAALAPARITCKQVAATRTAARSRTQKACEDHKWPATLRGCIVAGGGDPCFAAAGISPPDGP